MSFFSNAATFIVRRRRLWRRTISSSSGGGGNSMSENPNHNHHNLNNNKPCLLLSSPANPQSRYLYDLTFDGNGNGNGDQVFGMELKRELHLPNMAERILIGSSEGFVVSINISGTTRSTTITAFNPLTGSHLPVPRPPRIPRKSPLPQHILPIWKTTHSKPVPVPVRVGSSFLNLYTTKAIISPSLDHIVLFPPRSNPIFAPLTSSSSSSSSWIKIPSDQTWRCYEGIFHKGLLYAIDDETYLSVFDLKTKTFADGQPEFFDNEPIYKERHLQCSLVESPDGDDLFLVFRGIDEVAPHEDPRYLQTTSCQVFQLRFNKKKKRTEWDEVKSIGDLAFFVGPRSSSLSLHVDVGDRNLFPSLKPNSVYFSDSWSIHNEIFNPSSLGDAGVCCLDDGTVHYIELSDADHPQLDWPPPVWYMPTSTLQD